MDEYQTLEDLEALKEIREELIQQRYLEDPEYRSRSSAEASSKLSALSHPSGFEVLSVGTTVRMTS